ncbi:unnamed protein product, partial [Acanthoscelides obtectus]
AAVISIKTIQQIKASIALVATTTNSTTKIAADTIKATEVTTTKEVMTTKIEQGVTITRVTAKTGTVMTEVEAALTIRIEVMIVAEARTAGREAVPMIDSKATEVVIPKITISQSGLKLTILFKPISRRTRISTCKRATITNSTKEGAVEEVEVEAGRIIRGEGAGEDKSMRDVMY